MTGAQLRARVVVPVLGQLRCKRGIDIGKTEHTPSVLLMLHRLWIEEVVVGDMSRVSSIGRRDNDMRQLGSLTAKSTLCV